MLPNICIEKLFFTQFYICLPVFNVRIKIIFHSNRSIYQNNKIHKYYWLIPSIHYPIIKKSNFNLCLLQSFSPTKFLTLFYIFKYSGVIFSTYDGVLFGTKDKVKINRKKEVKNQRLLAWFYLESLSLKSNIHLSSFSKKSDTSRVIQL